MILNFLSKDKNRKIINNLSLVLFAAYIFSMFIYPIYKSRYSWDYVQSIWYVWQPINAGMLAFMASVIALNMSRINEEKQRNRNFIAARAFLPEALSELNIYLENCLPFLNESLGKFNENGVIKATTLRSNLPSLPISYKNIFKSCIAFAEHDIGNYLALILNHLQVNHSRLEHSFFNSQNEQSSTMILYINILDNIYDIAYLKVLIDNLYNFARGEDEFEETKVTIAMIKNAYHQLKIFPEVIKGLNENTESRFKNL